MELALRPFDYDSRADLEVMAKWSNDAELRPYSTVHRSDADYAKVITPEEIATWRPRARDGTNEAKYSWICLLDGEPVGECSLQMDVRHALTKEPRTGWFGIILGEPRARGRGYGERYFAMLEDEARRLGARRAELGVFAFNTRAIRLYERIGYARIGEVADLTWWDGRFWPDYRYLKRLAD